MNWKIFCCCFSFFIVVDLHAQNFNRPIPTGFHPYEFEELDSSFSGYYLMSAYKWGQKRKDLFQTMFDKNGYLAWYYEFDHPCVDFKWLPEHQRFSFLRVNGLEGVRFYDLDTTFQIIDSVSAVNGLIGDNHEFLTLKNGNKLILVIGDSTMDLSAYTFNGKQGSATCIVKYNAIQEFDQNDSLVFYWNCLDHIHPSEHMDGYKYNPNYFDYAHANSIDEDVDGNLLVSFRHLDAVYKIDHETGNVIWKLGGKSSSFTFPNDTLRFSGQHSARRTVNGNYGLYDNGNQKPAPNYSRAVEYELDTVNWTATMVFEYDASQTIYGPATGNYQSDHSDFKMIGWGNVRRPEPNTTLLNATGNVLSQFHFLDTVVSYRAYASMIDVDFPRPKITCSNNGVELILSAPAGLKNLEWSTGETSQSIKVTTNGTYMFWSDYGIGKLGSIPEIISDVNSHCLSTSIDDIDSSVDMHDVEYYDLLGRRVAIPKNSQLLLVRDKLGKAKLIIYSTY